MTLTVNHSIGNTMIKCRFCARDVSRDDLYVETIEDAICEACFDKLPADRRLFKLSRPKGGRVARVFSVTLVSDVHQPTTR